MPAYQTYQAKADSRRAKALAATTSPFTIEVRFLGGLTARQRAAFTAAADRWTRVIVGDLPSVLVDGEVIDDVLILAQGTAIDGPGRILGQAGPTHLRPASAGPAAFSDGEGHHVVRHRGPGENERRRHAERRHRARDGSRPRNRHAVGPEGPAGWGGRLEPDLLRSWAMEEYRVLRGGGRRRRVPVENTGGPGTRDAHWRETVFRNELMSGFIAEPGNPLSRLTVASLGDLGYEVDLEAGEPYELPNLFALAEAGALVQYAAPIDVGVVLPVIPITLPGSSLQARPARRRGGG